MHQVLKTIIFIGLIVSVIAIVNASSDGRTGATVNGCTCHGTSNTNTTVSVSAQSGSFTVQTGSTTTYTVTVSNGSYDYFGTNIAVKTTESGNTNAGSLTASNSDLQVSGGELTHTGPKNGSGSAAFTFTWTAPSTAGTYYLRAAGNAVDNTGGTGNDQWRLMTVQQITVVAPTEIVLTSPNGGENLCAGASHNVTWTSSSVTNVKIELSADGGSSFPTTLVASTPAASGSWTWNIPGGQAVANNYKVRISDASNASVNDVSQSNFSIAPVTQITSQPQSAVVCQGQQAQFSVTASGSGLSYKWRKDGVDLPNSNTANYTINNVQPANAGNYTCVVTGACGNPVGSSTAQLTVDATPKIVSQPNDTTLCAGGRATFSISAEGEEITYQWRKNGTAIQNATNASYTIQNVQKSHEGNYDCIVSGKCSPAATSESASLSVNEAVNIIKQPVPTTLCEGGEGVLFVSVSGVNLVYQWKKNGKVIENSDNDTLFFDNVSKKDEGFYSVSISGECTQEINSSSVSLVVSPLAEITEQPSAQEVIEGANVEFSVTAAGENLKYQWKKDGTNLSGKTSSKLVISNVKLADAGSYVCEITNSCGKISTDSVSLKVNPAGNGAVLSLSQASIDFEMTKIGSTRNEILVEGIKNTGNEDLIINGIDYEGTNAVDFQISDLSFPISIKPDESINLNVRFTPTGEGERNAVAKFISNAINETELRLKGIGAQIKIDTDIQVLSITAPGIGENGESTFEITNNSSVDIHANLSIIGPDSNAFSVKGDSDGLLIKKDSTIVVIIEYIPSTWMTIKAEVQIEVDETGDLSFVGLEGDVATSVEDRTKLEQVRIYPNPGNNNINIEIRDMPISVKSVEIFDNAGISIKRFDNNLLSGINSLIWDGADNHGNRVPSGNYRLLIQTTDGRFLSYPIVFLHN